MDGVTGVKIANNTIPVNKLQLSSYLYVGVEKAQASCLIYRFENGAIKEAIGVGRSHWRRFSDGYVEAQFIIKIKESTTGFNIPWQAMHLSDHFCFRTLDLWNTENPNNYQFPSISVTQSSFPIWGSNGGNWGPGKFERKGLLISSVSFDENRRSFG